MVSEKKRKVTPLQSPNYIEDRELLEKVRKKRRRGLTRRLAVFFIFIGVASVTMTSVIASQQDLMIRKQHKKAELEEKLAQMESKEQKLKSQIKKLNDPDYIAKIARRDLLMTKKGNGEIVFTTREDDEN